ncbi:MAG: hypothetical protein D6753_14915 [Planctomycetota bacterium]|nr:MAG: hypothetical protein D6753_14915 [Planctomycetota bacterium]
MSPPNPPADDLPSGESADQSSFYADEAPSPEPLETGEPVSGSPNPYAPTLQRTSRIPERIRIDLPVEYWAIVFFGLVFSGGLFLLVPWFSVMSLLATIAAAIRTAMLQRKLLSRGTLPDDVPATPVLLITSWFFSMLGIVASCVAFVAICLPTGFFFLAADTGMPRGVMVLPFGGGLLAGLACFIWLFRLSLRLPY